MRYKILVLLTFVLLGCEKKNKEIPGLLSKEKMINILIDIHILESKIELLFIPKDSGILIFNTFEREIFEEYQVSKEGYIKSYQYYLENMSGMSEIYTAVVDSLNFMQKSFEIEKEKAKKTKEKQSKDSLLLSTSNSRKKLFMDSIKTKKN